MPKDGDWDIAPLNKVTMDISAAIAMEYDIALMCISSRIPTKVYLTPDLIDALNMEVSHGR